jgi:hypothetical protein
MDTTFTPDEAELLVAILEERQRVLLAEISRTIHHEFKNALRENETLLESIIAKLKAAYPPEQSRKSA